MPLFGTFSKFDIQYSFNLLYRVNKFCLIEFTAILDAFQIIVDGGKYWLAAIRQADTGSIDKRGEGVGKKHIRQRGEGNYSGNYVVNIPSFLSAYEGEIKNLIDYYKPAGRTYVLKIYEYE